MSEPLKLTLLIKGKKKTFVEDFIPANVIIGALDLIDFEGAKGLRDMYNERVHFIADVFTDEAVTEDAIWDGLNALTFGDTLENILNQIAGVDPKNVETEPKND